MQTYVRVHAHISQKKRKNFRNEIFFIPRLPSVWWHDHRPSCWSDGAIKASHQPRETNGLPFAPGRYSAEKTNFNK